MKKRVELNLEKNTKDDEILLKEEDVAIESVAEEKAVIKPPKMKRSIFIMNIITFAVFVGSLVYAIVKVILAPGTSATEPTKGDFGLMILQCILGLFVMFLPTLLERKLKIDIPIFMEIVVIIFLFIAIFFGEVTSFYYKFKHWDTIAHATSGVMIALLGFSVVNILNKSNTKHMELAPGFVAFFAFCFAMALNSMWEIYEFCVDEFLGMNMQKFIPPGFNYDGAMLSDSIDKIAEYFRTREGFRYALMDTMEDLIIDFMGAALVSLVGYLMLKYKADKADVFIIKRLQPDGVVGIKVPSVEKVNDVDEINE